MAGTRIGSWKDDFKGSNLKNVHWTIGRLWRIIVGGIGNGTGTWAIKNGEVCNKPLR